MAEINTKICPWFEPMTSHFRGGHSSTAPVDDDYLPAYFIINYLSTYDGHIWWSVCTMSINGDDYLPTYNKYLPAYYEYLSAYNECLPTYNEYLTAYDEYLPTYDE